MASTSIVCFWVLAVFSTVYSIPVVPSPFTSSKAEVVYPPQPYEFGFKMDDGNGTVQHRQESANENGAVHGKYGYTDPLGIYREVEYKADENGYQAKILSNEPGMTNQNSANVVYVVNTNQA